jgi:hypothetical protein
MPTCIIIEIDETQSVPTIVTNNSHGNTVKSAFEFVMPVGWSTVIVATPYSLGVPIYEWLEARPDDYQLAICSYTMDGNGIRNFEKIPRVLGIPLFMPVSNDDDESGTSFTKSNIVFCGAGNTEPVNAVSRRIDTWDFASNLSSPNNLFTSFCTPVVAGKAAALVDAGLTPAQILKTVRMQATDYPTWDNQNGFGKAPASYTVPSYYDNFPPESVEWFRTGNNLTLFCSVIEGDTIDALTFYKDGEPYQTLTNVVGPAFYNSSIVACLQQYKVATTIFSGGGSFEFNVTRTANNVESQIFDWNEWTRTGFTNNDPSHPTAPPKFTELYVKQNKATSFIYNLPTTSPETNVQDYLSLRLLIGDNINLTPVAINTTAVYVNANANQMNVNTGYQRFNFDGQFPAGWVAISSGVCRIDKSV